MSIDLQIAVMFEPAISAPLQEFCLHGKTMGTRYSCTFFAVPWVDSGAIKLALQAAVDDVDQQMSPWIPGSELNRINSAPLNQWISVPSQFFQVVKSGLEIGRLSDGAFDIGLGALTNFYGFGPALPGKCDDQPPLAPEPAFEILETDEERSALLKRSPITLDLCGLAKGFGVDELARVLEARHIYDYLVCIDGDLRCSGLRADGRPWTIAIETPALEERSGCIELEVADIAIATSGSYRQRREWAGKPISHTMDRGMQGPLDTDIVSTTVAAETCMEADAWATAFMVAGLDNLKIETSDRDVLLLRDEGTGNGHFRAEGCGGFGTKNF